MQHRGSRACGPNHTATQAACCHGCTEGPAWLSDHLCEGQECIHMGLEGLWPQPHSNTGRMLSGTGSPDPSLHPLKAAAAARAGPAWAWHGCRVTVNLQLPGCTRWPDHGMHHQGCLHAHMSPSLCSPSPARPVYATAASPWYRSDWCIVFGGGDRGEPPHHGQ